jgi:predicted ferric reductase
LINNVAKDTRENIGIPQPIGTDGFRFVASVDFWVGISFRIPRAFPALGADSPLVALTRNLNDAVLPLTAPGVSAAETAVFVTQDGTKLRFIVTSKSTPTDVALPVERDKDISLLLRIRRNSMSGTLRWFLNGVRVVTIDGDPVGNLTADAAQQREPLLMLGVDPGWTLPHAGAAATLLVNTVRLARGPDARALVDPDPPGEPEPPIDPELRCRNRDGALNCPCAVKPICLDDGAMCAYFRNETGVCAFPGNVAVPASCSAIGVAGCPCYRLACRSDSSCDRSGVRGPVNFCVLNPPKAAAPPNPETGYSCVPSDPSMFPIVPGPADWFVVIVAIILLALSLCRWSGKLYGKDKLIMDDDDRIKMMTENGVLSTAPQLNMAAFGVGVGVGGGGGGGGSLSSSGGIDDDAMMAGGYPAPLPPVENDREAFSQYKKLPPAPMMVNVPQLTDGALARVAGNYARSPFGESDNKRQSVYRKSMGPLVQVDASGKCDVLKTLSFMWHRRLPGSEVRLRDAVVALCFLALHVLFFVGFQDPCLGAQVSGSEWRLQARAIGTTFGHMASADSLLLVVPATRNSILSVFLGLEFDETILFHRWLGALTLTLLAVHGLAYFPIWFDDWASFVTNRVPLPKFAFALASGVSAIVIGVLSLSFFRRNYFQVFYYAHYTFIVYFITGGLHSPKVFARLAIAAMAIYAVDRVVRFAAGVWPRRCVENVALDGNCTRIVFSKSRLASYAVGNYVFLNFPQISLFEWHPFTLSSGPHDPQNECHIKALGDFTTRVYEEASKSVALRSHLWVRVDGPYGKFSLNPELFPVIVLVGGGVGITPQVAALKAIYRVRMNNVARLEHSRSGVLKHVYFIWSCPDPEHYGWFAQLYDDCLARTLDDPSYPQLHLFVHLTRFKEVPPGLPAFVRHGRPDFHKYMPLFCVERRAELAAASGAVFACGQSEMVTGVWDASVQASLKHGVTWLFHKEEFNF